MPKTATRPVLVCSLDRASCKRLVTLGAALASEQQRPLTLLSVQPQELVSPDVAEDIQILYNIASGVGAEITVLFSDNPMLTLAVHASQIGAAEVIVDESDVAGTIHFQALRELLPDIPLSILQKDGQTISLPPTQKLHTAAQGRCVQLRGKTL